MTTNEELIKQYQAEWAAANAAGDETGKTVAHAKAEGARAISGYSGGDDGSHFITTGTNNAGTGTTQASGTGNLASATSLDDNVNSLYAAQKAQTLAGLKSAYDANVIDLNATAAKIPETYNTARNSTAATSAQNKASFNEAAAANGLNSGTGGQASLSMANTLAGNLSSLDKAQASSVADIETQRSKLTTAYNNAIQAAVAENDYEKAQALYNEAVRVDNSLVSTSQAQASLDTQTQQYNQQYQTSQNKYSDSLAQSKAETLAAYGDFSGYKALGYSDEMIAGMKAYWNIVNGTATSGGSSSGYSGSSGNGGGGNSDNTPLPTSTLPNYGSSDIADVNQLVSNGYSRDEIVSILKQALANGEITQSQYNAKLDAALRMGTY